MNRVLVVVDMQKDFVDGALGSKEAVAIVPKVVEKIKTFDGEIFVTKDTHEENYLDTQEGVNLPVVHCLKDSSGWDLISPVNEICKQKHESGERVEVFTKPTFGSVELAKYLAMNEKINEVVLIGLCTDICVISNAMLIKAFLPEVKVTVDAACCAGVTPESHNNALAAMKMCQINIENWEG